MPSENMKNIVYAIANCLEMCKDGNCHILSSPTSDFLFLLPSPSQIWPFFFVRASEFFFLRSANSSSSGLHHPRSALDFFPRASDFSNLALLLPPVSTTPTADRPSLQSASHSHLACSSARQDSRCGRRVSTGHRSACQGAVRLNDPLVGPRGPPHRAHTVHAVPQRVRGQGCPRYGAQIAHQPLGVRLLALHWLLGLPRLRGVVTGHSPIFYSSVFDLLVLKNVDCLALVLACIDVEMGGGGWEVVGLIEDGLVCLSAFQWLLSWTTETPVAFWALHNFLVGVVSGARSGAPTRGTRRIRAVERRCTDRSPRTPRGRRGGCRRARRP